MAAAVAWGYIHCIYVMVIAAPRHLSSRTILHTRIFFQTYTCKDRKSDCLTNVTKPRGTINIAVVARRFGSADGSSVLSFSHKMKVLHIDLMIETEAEIAIWSSKLLRKVMVLLQLTSQNAQIGALHYL